MKKIFLKNILTSNEFSYILNTERMFSNEGGVNYDKENIFKESS